MTAIASTNVSKLWVLIYFTVNTLLYVHSFSKSRQAMRLIYYVVDKSLYIIRKLFIIIDCQFSNLASVVTYHCMDVLRYRRYKCMERNNP